MSAASQPQRKYAILLLAHGTPETVAEIPEYLKNVVSGRALPQHVVEEIQHRYAQIGRSPLTDWTFREAELLQKEIDLPVYVGMRNWKPYISETVRQMREDGVTDAVGICMAPQNSRTSVGLYRRAADAGGKVPVIFTAHSVPCRTVQVPQPAVPSPEPTVPPVAGPVRPTAPERSYAMAGAAAHTPDPYAVQAKHTAALVAEQLSAEGLEQRDWYFAFQSQGASGGPWIGPTVEDTLRALQLQGERAAVLQPVGFLCDHVEILYDIDIAFQQLAGTLGMKLSRPESLNTSSLLIAALADLAEQGLAQLKAESSLAIAAP